MIPFMDITEENIKLSVQVNIVAATAFAQEAVAAFMAQPFVLSHPCVFDPTESNQTLVTKGKK